MYPLGYELMTSKSQVYNHWTLCLLGSMKWVQQIKVQNFGYIFKGPRQILEGL